MTATVIEAGPATVRGPAEVPRLLGTTALQCVDDSMVLVDDQLVSVDDLWTDVLRTAAGPDCRDVVVVHPTWWTGDQADRIRRAAGVAFPEAANIAVRHRAEMLAAAREGPSWAVVEIADEFVVVSRPEREPVIVVRGGTADSVIAAVSNAVGQAGEVVIDIAAGVAGAEALGHALAQQLRCLAVSLVDTLPDLPDTEPDLPAQAHRSPGRWIAICAGLSVAVLCGVFAVTVHRPSVDASTVTLIEGRVGMQVPSTWTAERLTGGSGSARVQIVSPKDPAVALHLTQSALVPGEQVADTLRRLVDAAPPGIFVEFNSQDLVVGRAAITYRELRDRRHVRWVVVVERDIRIAIGCQSAPQRSADIQGPCDDAVRTVHAIA